MGKPHYKAFLSYSHTDERWAKWLHRALENYRIPRGVQGVSATDRRIAPVFRDREELAAAATLSSSIRDALSRSENLVVLCSPDAARSEWVNEEIRQFRQGESSDRVFCIVVEGDAAKVGVGSVFPPALFDGVAQRDQEPLAADPRPWADGKRLALQKLVAAMLGVGLDELRRRDHQRRRIRLAFGGCAATALLVLLIFTMMTWSSEREQKARTEELAGFMVDLGERVGANVDLETLQLMTSQANRVFEDMNWRSLSPDLGIKVALAIRQFAAVSDSQGRKTEAREGYERSLHQLTVLHKRFPENVAVLFELSQAQFYLGDHFFWQEAYDLALPLMEAYEESARLLLQKNPESADYQLELAYALTSQAAIRFDGQIGPIEEVFRLSESSLDRFSRVLVGLPENATLLSHYSNMLAWSAEAQEAVCNLQEAVKARQEVLAVTEQAVGREPGNKVFRAEVAYAHSGLAKLRYQQGRLADAQSLIVRSIDLLETLLVSDPSNTEYRKDINNSQLFHAKVLSGLGDHDDAIEIMVGLAPDFGQMPGAEVGSDGVSVDAHVSYLVDFAALSASVGEAPVAAEALSRALQAIQAHQDMDDRRLKRHLSEARYLDTLLLNESTLDWRMMPDEAFLDESFGRLSCVEYEVLAKQASLAGDRDRMDDHVTLLQRAGYKAPSFLEFCSAQGGCGEASSGGRE